MTAMDILKEQKGNRKRSSRGKLLGVAFSLILHLGSRNFVGSDFFNFLSGSICNCWRLARYDHLDWGAEIFNTVKSRKIADVDRLTDSKTADVNFDVIRKLGWAATNFNVVRLVVNHATFILHADRVSLTSQMNRHVCDEAFTTGNFMEVDVRDAVFNRIALNFLYVRESGLALLIDQFDERSAAADLAFQITEINY